MKSSVTFFPLSWGILLLLSFFTWMSCASRKLNASMTTIPAHFDWQGHRGCRGLMPENTIEGFLEALRYPVTTLEMDIVVSADSQLIVSHEPWMNTTICSGPGLSAGAAHDTTNIFRLAVEEVQQYDCGSKGNPEFERQKKIPAVKPTLSEVVHAVMEYCDSTGRSLPYFNIELKSRKTWYDKYVPRPEVFVRLVLDELHSLGITKHVTLQSFDVSVLREIHSTAPDEIRISYLTERAGGIDRSMLALGFTPDIYSPHYLLLSRKIIEQAHAKNMKVIPWTINRVELFQKFIARGVDGIITDYPDLIIRE